MGINFPAAPIIGELYPTPAIAGIPQYKWDGTVWLAVTPSALTYVQRGGDTMTGHLALPTAPAAANAVRRDFVEAYAAPFDAMSTSGMQINGSMDVSQELGAAGTATHTKYICDSWQMQFVGTMAISGFATNISNPFSPFPNYMLIQPTTAQASLAAGDYALTIQGIEGYRIARLGWGTANAKPITIGFWTAHNRIGLHGGSIRNGVANRSYAFSYTQNVADTPQFNIVTIPGDTTGTWNKDNTAGIYLTFAVASGATSIAPSVNTWVAGSYVAPPGTVNGVGLVTDRFRLVGVVVLPGSQAPTAAQSPTIMRPYDQELATCQRYYQKYTGVMMYVNNGLPSNGVIEDFWFSVDMRAAPTITFANNAAAVYAYSGPTTRRVTYAFNNTTGTQLATFDTILDARL